VRWAWALALALSVPPIAITAAHNASRDGAGVLVSYNTGINLCPPTEPYSTFCDGDRAFACNVGELNEVRCDQFLDSHCEAREDGAVARCRSPLWP
jgi:hypothetical protein